MMEILAAVLGAVATGFVGYFLGKNQAKQQGLYERRSDALTEIRSQIFALARDFENWAYNSNKDFSTSYSEYILKMLPLRIKEGDELRNKLHSLLGYYHAQKPYLETRTRNTFDSLTDQFSKQHTKLWMALLTHHTTADIVAIKYDQDEPNPYNAKEAVGSAYEWSSRKSSNGLWTLLDGFEKEVDRVVGSRKWWRV